MDSRELDWPSLVRSSSATVIRGQIDGTEIGFSEISSRSDHTFFKRPFPRMPKPRVSRSIVAQKHYKRSGGCPLMAHRAAASGCPRLDV